MSTLCTLNNLVNAYAALMRANKPETVSIVLILTVCSSCLYTYLYEHYNGSSATPGLAISRVYIGGRERVISVSPRKKTSNSSLKTRGAAAPRTRNTWASLLGLEEPSLKLLRSAELQRTNSSPISNCRHSKSAIVISCNIECNINSSLRLRLGTHIIYISIG